MLSLALAATLIGFVLLVLGLITGHLALAVACIVVCVLGLVFLIADIFRGGRGSGESDRGDSAVGTDTQAGGAAAGAGGADDDSTVGDSGVYGADGAVESTARTPADPSESSPDSGLTIAQAAGAGGAAGVGLAAQQGGPSDAPTMQLPTESAGAPSPVQDDGTYADYLRSVGADPQEEAVPGAEEPAGNVTTSPQATTGTENAGMWPGDADYTEVFPPQPRAWPSQPETGEVPQEQAWRGWPHPAAGLDESGWPRQPGGHEHPTAPNASGTGDRRDWAPGGDADEKVPDKKFDPLDPNWRPPSH